LKEQCGDKEKAKIPVVAIVKLGDVRKLVRFGRQFWVQDCRTTVQALNSAHFIAHMEMLTGV
jgi:DNA polymerase III subunit alpha